MRVASHLRIPVAELKARIGWSEFLDWLAFLENEISETAKLDYYLAQIAMEVRKANSDMSTGDRNGLKITDLLLTFTSPADLKEASRQSKITWAGLLGIELPPDAI